MPLKIEGTKADKLIAFVRRLDGRSLLVAVPRLIATLLGDSTDPPIASDLWKDTHILFPPEGAFCGSYRNVFTDEVLQNSKSSSRIAVAELLGEFPVGLWVSSLD